MENDNKTEKNELTVNEAVPDYNNRYTFADYMKWDDNQRWELIDGVPYLMSAPTVEHQRISGRIYLQIASYLEGKSCEVFYAPFDVRLAADTTDDTVVQPDIVIICDKSVFMKTGCRAAPDMIIEILSPSTSIRDRDVKFKLYQRTGVKEYWIVDPVTKMVYAHILDNGLYYIKYYKETDKAPVLDSFKINLADVFRD